MNPDNPMPANSTDPNSYFVNQEDDLAVIERKRKINNILHAIQYYGIKIWPFVNRVIQTIVYFIINLIKGVINMALDQIKNFRG